MALIPGVNLLSTTGELKVSTFISAAALSVGDLVFMTTASGKVDKIAAGTNIDTTNTGSGIVGVCVSACAATDQGVQVAVIDGNTRLILPNCATARTQAQIGANSSYVLIKLSATTNGVPSGMLAVDLATTANGCVRIYNTTADATGFTGTFVVASDGLTGGVITPASGCAAAALITLSMPEAARWVKG